MAELTELIFQIREYIVETRASEEINGIDYFFLSMLEISANLVELGIFRNREITLEEEKNWFKGSYHLDFWDSEVNVNLYIPMIKNVEKLNYFRK